MSDSITPALTPEEWKARCTDRSGSVGVGDVVVVVDSVYVESEGFSQSLPYRHATAALCLYGQPFGFAQADVEAVMACAKASQNTGLDSDTFLRAEGVSRKLAALLPPPESPT